MSIYDAFNQNKGSSFDVQKAIAELENLRNSQESPKQTLQSPNFKRLEDYTKDMQNDKVQWILSQNVVSEKYKTMREKFNDYLWTLNYMAFDDFCEKNNLPYCKDYVDTFIDNIGNYVNPIDKQSKEIEELKKQIAELQKGKSEVL